MSAKFTGVTFAKQKVTPAYDAVVRRALLTDGTLTGCAISYSGTTLTMAAGQLMICGRQIVHPSAQNWAVTEATSGYARLVLTIDLTRTSTKETFEQVQTEVQYATAADGFVALEQTDINGSGTIYQVSLCVVSLGTGGITGIVSQIEQSEGGGAGLNFKVVGGTTAPVSPTENTIWLNTPVSITSWIFSATEPEAPETGMVWISIGTASVVAFNALKKNGLTVCPIAAKQYIDGQWEAKEAKSYKDGEWVSWVTDIIAYDGGIKELKLTFQNASDKGTYILLTLGKNSNSASKAATVKTPVVNLTGLEKLEVTYSNLSGDGSFAGRIQAVVWEPNGTTVKKNSTVTSSKSGTCTVDVSDLSGEYIIGAYGYNTSGSYEGSCRLKSIKAIMADTTTAADTAALAAENAELLEAMAAMVDEVYNADIGEMEG